MNRDLSRYLAMRVVSTIGVQIQSVAIGWQIYEATDDAMALGWAGLAQFLPLVLLSFSGGALADRASRKRVTAASLLAYGVGAAGLGVVASVEEVGVLPIYGILVGLGATRAFAFPASVALLPELVEPSRLPRAIAMSSTAYQVATIAGPALGGVIYAAAGPTAAYGSAAGCAVLAAALIATVETRPAPRKPSQERGLERLMAGLRFVVRERVLLGAIGLDLVAVLLGGSVALLPIFARDVLEVGETGLGLLRSAPACGAALTALFFAFRPIERRAGAWMLVSVALFGVATVAFGLSARFELSLLALFVLGAADMVSVVIRHSLVQLWTPDEMRGRVASVNMVFIGASNELGEFESGLTAAWLGAVRATVLGGVGTLLATGLFTVLFPGLREVDQLAEREPP